MKSIVFYRSYYGNTKLVAEAIASELKARGHDAEAQDMRIKPKNIEELDSALIGAPTRIGGVTGKALSVLRRLKKKGFGNKPVALYETCGIIPTTPEEIEENKRWFFPGAAGIMLEYAKKRGLNAFPLTLRCEVSGMKGPLVEGAIEKAKAFARAFSDFAEKG